MNPMLKIAYEHGAQVALAELGLAKSASFFPGSRAFLNQVKNLHFTPPPIQGPALGSFLQNNPSGLKSLLGPGITGNPLSDLALVGLAGTGAYNVADD